MDENALVSTLPDGSLERIEVKLVLMGGLFYLETSITLIKDGQATCGETSLIKLGEIMQRRLSEAVHNGIRQD